MMAFCTASGPSVPTTRRHTANTKASSKKDPIPSLEAVGSKSKDAPANPTNKEEEKEDINHSDFPVPCDLPRIGQSLFPVIWHRDPAPSAVKAFYCGLTVVGLASIIYLADILHWWNVPVDTSWDERHGMDNAHDSFVDLMQWTLGLSRPTIHILSTITLGICGLLIAADVMHGNHASTTNDNNHNHPYSPWPESWNTDNTLCYHDMFAEPTRFGRLLRRPGNTLSNGIYLFTALVVAASASGTPFWLADIIFAVMLFLLGIFSTIWHGSNAPWSQYPDVWTMDSCIVYLLLRYVCLGGMHLYKSSHADHMDEVTLRWMAGMACGLLYTAVILGVVGRGYYQLYHMKWLHGPCPYSARARLLGTSNIFGAGHHDIFVGSTVCGFCALPIGFMLLPTLMEVVVLKQLGSVTCGRFAMASLVVGWTYRMLERWVLDGNPVMNYFVGEQPQPSPSKEQPQPSWPLWRTVGAAIFSGTAQMHFWTGITLLTGYMHARSVEEDTFRAWERVAE